MTRIKFEPYANIFREFKDVLKFRLATLQVVLKRGGVKCSNFNL